MIYVEDIIQLHKRHFIGGPTVDYGIIEIATNLDDDGKNINNKKVNVDTKENYLQQLNFHNKDIPWSGIKQIIMELDWPKPFIKKRLFKARKSLCGLLQ